jgi:hypothetical protein
MTQENTILDFNAAINALNSASESFKIDVYIPSKQKTMSFKEIDAKQQKNLLSAAIDNSVYNSDFIKTFYNILKENVLLEDKSIIDELTLADRSFIAIALRSQVSDDLSVKFNDELSEKISLASVISKFNNYKTPKSEEIEVKNNNVSIIAGISLPTIKIELDYEENFYKDYKKIDEIKTNKDIQSIISDAFISETSKYISYISINESKFDFASMSFNQKLRLVEKLPSGLIQRILEKISTWKKDIDSILTVSSGNSTKTISIDSMLFLS